MRCTPEQVVAGGYFAGASGRSRRARAALQVVAEVELGPARKRTGGRQRALPEQERTMGMTCLIVHQHGMGGKAGVSLLPSRKSLR